MATYYVISDIHGHSAQMEAALARVPLADPAVRLVLLGDYVDRGPDSRGCLELARSAQTACPEQVVVLAGNHEAWLLEWLDGPDSDFTWLWADPDLETVRSFLDGRTLAAALGHDDPESDASALDGPEMNRRFKAAIKERHGDLIAWVRGLPLVHETEQHIFVHAGVDEDAGDYWRATTPEEMLTEKFPASLGGHEVGKLVVAGHVHCRELHGVDAPYADDGHIYVDGAVELSGALNLVRIETDGAWASEAVTA